MHIEGFVGAVGCGGRRVSYGKGESGMRRTEVEFNLWPPCLLGRLPHFLYLDIECWVGIPYTWQLLFYKMAAKNYVRRVVS